MSFAYCPMLFNLYRLLQYLAVSSFRFGVHKAYNKSHPDILIGTGGNTESWFYGFVWKFFRILYGI